MYMYKNKEKSLSVAIMTIYALSMLKKRVNYPLNQNIDFVFFSIDILGEQKNACLQLSPVDKIYRVGREDNIFILLFITMSLREKNCD